MILLRQGGATTDAAPTPTHLALAGLRAQGLVHTWIQQNHDGLPQKAGWPQEDLIEVHGSWYDPSNPVVCYDGSLRSDLYDKVGIHLCEPHADPTPLPLTRDRT